MNGEMHWGGWGVLSLIVVGKGQSGLHARFFRFWQYRPSKHRAWTQAAAMAQIGWCRIPTVMGNERVKVWWLVWVCGGNNGLFCVRFSWCSWLDIINDVWWTYKHGFPHLGAILPRIHECSSILMPPHIATASQESFLHEHLGHHLYSKWSKLGGLHNWKPCSLRIVLPILDCCLAWALARIKVGVWMILYLFDIKMYL